MPPIGGTGPIAVSGDGILGGVQIGYNWQAGAFVYGLETDFQLSGADGTFTGNVGGGARTFTGSASNEWFGTIRARLGRTFECGESVGKSASVTPPCPPSEAERQSQLVNCGPTSPRPV